MHRGKKVIFIFISLVLVIVSGCSSARKTARTVDEAGMDTGGLLTFEELEGKNLAQDGLFIRRFRVDLKVGGANDRFSGNLRIDKRGRWLASIRMVAGIEVFRVYADRSGVVVLDRLARSATIYEWERIERDYGFNYDILPLIIGDTPAIDDLRKIRLSCGKMNRINISGNTILLKPDCEKGKISIITVRDIVSGREMAVEYGSFLKINESSFPGEMQASEPNGTLRLKLNYEDIQSPWEDNVEFAIPSNYRIVK